MVEQLPEVTVTQRTALAHSMSRQELASLEGNTSEKGESRGPQSEKRADALQEELLKDKEAHQATFSC